jgi:hypothetical protein
MLSATDVVANLIGLQEDFHVYLCRFLSQECLPVHRLHTDGFSSVCDCVRGASLVNGILSMESAFLALNCHRVVAHALFGTMVLHVQTKIRPERLSTFYEPCMKQSLFQS